MDATIKNVKAMDLTELGNVKVTYAKVNTEGKFGEEVRLIVKDKDGNAYGVTTTAKQIVRTVKDMNTDDKDIIGALVRFKAYDTDNGFKTVKMFVQVY